MRTWRITKDIVFLFIAFWLISTGRFLPILFGLIVIAWYGYDLYNVVRAMILEKKAAAMQEQEPQQGPITTSAQDDGKITLTNSHEIKEADFEKE